MTSLHHLMSRGTELLGSEYSILCGAMSWVSERNLVSAISNAGGFGVIACGAMDPDLLKAEIAATQALTEKPFGVNLITMHPQFEDLIEAAIEQKVSHIVIAGGLPPQKSLERIKAAGVKVLCFAPTVSLAKRLMRVGADALIIEGMEAGGHIGPVSTSVLAQEIIPAVGADIPVFVAGGIGRGEAIASYLEMGASGVQLGTRFVCATESIAHPAFKKAFIRASARDAVASVQVDPRLPVIPVRALKNKAMGAFNEEQQKAAARHDSGELTLVEAQLEVEKYWAGALRRGVIEGDVDHGSLMAGQSVGMIDSEESAADILARLVRQAETALAK